MSSRERILKRIAEKEARISFGTHDITMEQWAMLYDRVEWTYRKTSLHDLGKIALDETLADYDYYPAEDSEDRRTDRMVADERRARACAESSGEASYA